MAAADFGGRVRVIDSGSISMGIGFLALTAAEHGGDLDEVERALRERVPRVRLYCVLDTLKYVVMGGRVSRAKAAAGGMLRLKPLMELVDGEIEQVGLARGFDKGLERIVELVDAAGPIERLAVIHGAAPEAAARLEDLLAARFSEMQVITGQIGPVVGTHAGPGAVGAIIVKGG
jgi:DegV family protein with EDD domain